MYTEIVQPLLLKPLCARAMQRAKKNQQKVPTCLTTNYLLTCLRIAPSWQLSSWRLMRTWRGWGRGGTGGWPPDQPLVQPAGLLGSLDQVLAAWAVGRAISWSPGIQWSKLYSQILKHPPPQYMVMVPQFIFVHSTCGLGIYKDF